MKLKAWYLKDGSLGLGEWNTGTGKMTTLSEAPGTIRIYYTKKATPLSTTLSTKPDIPSHFHDALSSKVLETLFARSGDYNAAAYHQNKWKSAIMDAKKEVNKGKDGTQYRITGYDY